MGRCGHDPMVTRPTLQHSGFPVRIQMGKAGEIRQKRGDTLVSTLRREYGDDFAAGIRSDAKLETVRERTGKSLHRLVRDMPKKT